MALMISDKFMRALEEIGIADQNTRRVVIDFQCGHIPIVYIERYGDDKLLKVMQTLDGVEITREEVKREPKEPGPAKGVITQVRPTPDHRDTKARSVGFAPVKAEETRQ